MMKLVLACFLALLVGTSILQEPEEIHAGEWVVVALEQSPAPDGGYTTAYTFRAEQVGKLYARAWSDDADPTLRLSSAAEAGATMTGHAGAENAFAPFTITEPTDVRIEVELPVAGEVRLLLTEAPELAESLEVERMVLEGLECYREVLKAGDVAQARRILGEIAASALEAPPEQLGPRSAAVLRRLTNETRNHGLMPLSLTIVQRTRPYYSRHLPDEHPWALQEQWAFAVAHLRMDPRRCEQLCTDGLAVTDRCKTKSLRDMAWLFHEVRGLARQKRGHLHEAGSDFEAVLEIRPNNLVSANNLVGILLELGDFLRAQLESQRLVALIESGARAHPRNRLAILANHAIALVANGAPKRAAESFRQVLEGFRKLESDDHPEVRLAIQNYATVQMDLGERDGPREAFEGLIEGRDPATDQSTWVPLQNLSSIYSAAGDVARAREIQEDLLVWRRRAFGPGHPDIGYSLRSLAKILVSQRDSEALDELLVELGSWALARVVSVAERSRRERGEVVIQVGAALRTMLIGAGLLDEPKEVVRLAFETSESLRALTSLSADLPGAADMGGDLRELREEWKSSVLDLVHAKEASLVQLRRREAAERALAGMLASGGYQVPPIVRLEDVAAGLESTEAVVAYRRVELYAPIAAHTGSGSAPADFYVAFVVTRGGALKLVDLGPTVEIDGLIARWRIAIKRPLPGTDELAASHEDGEIDVGRLLRAKVLDPVLEATEEASTLHVCMDDSLHLVPLDALPADGSAHRTVGDSLRVRMLSSLHWLGERPRSKPSSSAFLGVGDIEYGEGEGFSVMPASGKQVERARQLFAEVNRGTAVVLTGADATIERIREAAERSTHVHIGTHGDFLGGDVGLWADRGRVNGAAMSIPQLRRGGLSPLAAVGLALAEANALPDAGEMLTGAELATWDLHRCQLAVLNACDTNVGLLRAGTEIASLRAACHAAGVQTTLTTLWPVDKGWATEILDRFYEGLWRHGRTPQEALWEAKKYARDQRAEVRDWAPWVLSSRR
ncbi:MAG: CHAT domain-containing protein [bacterium]|nr:CHAT domain-containing protein [bacterium]